MQYGGMWSAAGVSGCGDAANQGKAFITVGSGTEQAWDISALSLCHSGSSCPPVTHTFTDGSFMVPQCDNPTTTITKTLGRGTISSPVDPSMATGFRGEVEFSDDTFDGSDLYEATVEVSCGGAAVSSDAAAVRLACANTIGTNTCHQVLCIMAPQRSPLWH